MNRSSRPLDGTLIVELGTSVAAPFGAQILGDLGASVVKVERPGAGDDSRSWGPPFWEGTSATFQAVNRNKRSVVVDLKNPSQCEYLKWFILNKADVVIQNLRPGLVTRFGLGSELIEENPRLIYCNLGAFGSVGPLSNRPGYDPLMQAFGGLMSITGLKDMPPVRIGASIIDMASGMWAVIGILAALHRRRDTGQGGRVDTSLYETAIAWMTLPIAYYFASGDVPGKHGSGSPIVCPYRAFDTLDGHVMVAVGNDKLFAKFCDALGRSEWITDDQYVTNADRVRNRERLESLLANIFRTKASTHWIDTLNAVGVPCTRLQTVDQVVEHPQTQALEMLRTTEDGKLCLTSSPLTFDGERPGVLKSPPKLGDFDSEFYDLTTRNKN